jgi:hypothetical protein
LELFTVIAIAPDNTVAWIQDFYSLEHAEAMAATHYAKTDSCGTRLYLVFIAKRYPHKEAKDPTYSE